MATGGNNLELALRIKADVAQAKAALKQTQDEIRGVGRATEQTNATSASATRAVSAQTQATTALAVAQKAGGETEAQASARLQAMIAQSGHAAEAATARAAAERAASGAVAQSTTREIAQHKALAAAQTAAMQSATNRRAPLVALRTILAKNKLTTAELAKAELLLDKVQASGIITNAELKQSFRALDAAKIVDTKVTQANAKANLEAAGARKLNSRATGELATAGSEILAGNFGRLRRTGAAFANQTGLLAKAFSLAGAGIIGTVAALALLAKGFIDGQNQSEALRKDILLTGNAAGVTSGQLEGMVQSIGASSGRYGDARKAINALAASGKVAGEDLQRAGQAAVDMSRVTGKSIDEAVQQIIRLGDDPVTQIKKLNESYHFLTAAQYTQIKALQDEGHERQAASLAEQIYAQNMHERALEVEKNAGLMERAGHSVAEAWDKAWDSITGVGRDTPINTQIAKLQAKLDALQKPSVATSSNPVASARGIDLQTQGVSDKNRQAQIAAVKAQIFALRGKQVQAALAASASEDAAQANQDAIAARDRLDKFASAGDVHDKALKKAAIDRTRALYGVVDPAERAKIEAEFKEQVKQADAAYKAALKKDQGPKGPTHHSSAAEREAKARAKAAAAANQGLIQSIIQMQAQLDPAASAWATYNKAVAQANTQAAIAKTASNADVVAIDAEKNAVIALAKQQRDVALATIIHADAVKKLQAVQQQQQTIQADASRQSQQVQAEQQAGLISQYSARKQLLAIRQKEAAQLQQLLPTLRAVAAATGDPRAIQGVKDLAAEIARLKIQTNDLKTAFESGLTSGLEQALEGLATGAMTVGQAFRELATTVIQSLAQVAARALAAKAIGALSSLFGGPKSADVGAGAGKLTLASAALGVAGGVLGLNSDKLQKAADTLLIANAVGVAAGFAGGGYTGPGGTYDVAGVVHAGEYVQPARRVAEPGALGFMRAFHRQGMAALASWAPGCAGGGYVAALHDVPTPQLPATPRPRLSAPAGGGKAAPSVSFRNVNLVDPDLVKSYLRGGGGTNDVLNIIKENRSTIRQLVS